MSVQSPTRKLTYEDLASLPDDGFRHELLEGVLVVTPPPDPPHQEAGGNLYFALRLYLREHPVGKAYYAPMGVRLTAHDVVEPDLLFISSERLSILGPRYVDGAPDLVVEVLSPSTRRRDLGKKRALYERRGAGEYWVLDFELRTATVFLRQGATFQPPIVLSAEAGDRLTTPLLPGFEIPLSVVFER